MDFLRHPFGVLVLTRLGRTRTWWAAQVLSAGISAVFLAMGLIVLVVVVPLVTHGWSWHWGPWSRLKLGPLLLKPGWHVAWRIGLEEVDLLTLGLWAMGVLQGCIGPLVAVPPGRLGRSGGPQFGVVCPGIDTGVVGPAWRSIFPGLALGRNRLYVCLADVDKTVAYAFALLLGATGGGFGLVRQRPWAMVHGGTV